MTTYKVYVRGHGGEEAHRLPPSENVPITLITLGQFGSTMSDEVADKYIFEHFGTAQIQNQIDNEEVIYWTKAARDEYYENGTLNFTKPALSLNPYETLSVNLALDGDSTIGDCGVCYWNAAKAEIEWIIKLEDKQTIYLAEILEKLKGMVSYGVQIELYWTACMSAEYWNGKNKKVSFNPTKK